MPGRRVDLDLLAGSPIGSWGRGLRRAAGIAVSTALRRSTHPGEAFLTPWLGSNGNASLLGKRDLEVLHQARLEIEDVVEILATILGRLAHPADADEVENDLAEIAGVVHAPTVENSLGHVAVLFERVAANRRAQLLTGEVLLFLRLVDVGIVVRVLARIRLPTSPRSSGALP